MSELRLKIKLGASPSRPQGGAAPTVEAVVEEAPAQEPVSVLRLLRKRKARASTARKRMRPVFRGQKPAAETESGDGAGEADRAKDAKGSRKRKVRNYSVWEKVAAYTAPADKEEAKSEPADAKVSGVPEVLQRARSHSRSTANMSPDEMKSLWSEAQTQYRGQLARKLKLQEIERKIKEDRAREIQALRALAQEEEARRKRKEDEAKDREERERNEAREKARQDRERLTRTIDMDAQKQIMQDDGDDDDDDDDMGGF